MRPSSRLSWLITSLATLAGSACAHACPFCDGAGGVNQVRAAVFGDDFWPHLFAAAAPFAVLAAAAAFLRYGPAFGGGGESGPAGGRS